jgi:toxin-antitoxin system PIN domain toxin
VARVALLDVNVLVALFDPDHVHHEAAHDWFADHRNAGWATCPLTENGFLRVVTNPRFREDAPRLATVTARLRQFCASGHHHFWTETVSIRDERRFNLSLARGHAQITDVYLLGLAAEAGGCLATFDRTIPIGAVVGATRETLSIIAPADI